MAWTQDVYQSLDELLALARISPTGQRRGLLRPDALARAEEEEREFHQHLAAGDRLGAVMEAGDVAYYLNLAVYNGQVEQAEALARLERLAARVNVPLVNILEAAAVKFSVRFRANRGRKDDAAERRRVADYLRHVAGIPVETQEV